MTQKNGDMLSLRWRDSPRQKPVVRHRLNLARLCPAMSAGTAAHCTTPQLSAAKSEQTPPLERGDGTERRQVHTDEGGQVRGELGRLGRLRWLGSVGRQRLRFIFGEYLNQLRRDFHHWHV